MHTAHISHCLHQSGSTSTYINEFQLQLHFVLFRYHSFLLSAYLNKRKTNIYQMDNSAMFSSRFVIVRDKIKIKFSFVFVWCEIKTERNKAEKHVCMQNELKNPFIINWWNVLHVSHASSFSHFNMILL